MAKYKKKKKKEEKVPQFLQLVIVLFFSYQVGDCSMFQVLLYGGQVVSWKNERREELLFMSSKVSNLLSYFHGSFVLTVLF